MDKTGGIIGFVSNSGWLEGNSMDGFRHCLEEEFSSIYVLNLRGAIRNKSGDIAKKEGQNVFNIMTGVAITILVKNPDAKKEKADIHYFDIGEYLSREEKLKTISDIKSIFNPEFDSVLMKPNKENDWLNLRNDLFNDFIPLGDKTSKTIKATYFNQVYSRGVATAKDNWCYNYSKNSLKTNMCHTIDFYNKQRINYHSQNNIDKIEDFISYSDVDIAWNRSLKNYCKNNVEILYKENAVRNCMYRPFVKQMGYIDRKMNDMIYQIPKLFPCNECYNEVIVISGLGGSKEKSVLITNLIPDLNILDSGAQCFPLYWYEEKPQNDAPQMNLFASNNNEKEKYTRHNGVTDFIYNLAKEKYGHKVVKEDIFYYVYGILHSEDYRTKFSADLKKMLPRIPLVDKVEDFWAFSDAGRDLAKLHLNYEDQAPIASIKVIGEESGIYVVDKMRFKSKQDKSEIIYNPYIRITNIPEVAYEYVVNGRSAIEWILEKYQVTIDKTSGIKNDPNDWAKEHNKSRYILDLLLSVISLSVATVKIVKNLPKLNFSEEK